MKFPEAICKVEVTATSAQAKVNTLNISTVERIRQKGYLSKRFWNSGMQYGIIRSKERRPFLTLTHFRWCGAIKVPMD
jgi:hypothetical protein